MNPKIETKELKITKTPVEKEDIKNQPLLENKILIELKKRLDAK